MRCGPCGIYQTTFQHQMISTRAATTQLVGLKGNGSDRMKIESLIDSCMHHVCFSSFLTSPVFLRERSIDSAKEMRLMILVYWCGWSVVDQIAIARVDQRQF